MTAPALALPQPLGYRRHSAAATRGTRVAAPEAPPARQPSLRTPPWGTAQPDALILAHAQRPPEG